MMTTYSILTDGDAMGAAIIGVNVEKPRHSLFLYNNPNGKLFANGSENHPSSRALHQNKKRRNRRSFVSAERFEYHPRVGAPKQNRKRRNRRSFVSAERFELSTNGLLKRKPRMRSLVLL
jgi:hypothetical protein